MVYLNNQQDAIALVEDHWQGQAEAIAERLGVDAATEWSLTFVDEPAIQIFNAQYRGFDLPTDVLSFSQLEGPEDFVMPDDMPLLGDVVVSVPTARRQAEERGHAFEAELSLLIAHGLLHLLGEDHDTPERKAHMWARQQDVLDHLGLVVRDFGDA